MGVRRARLGGWLLWLCAAGAAAQTITVAQDVAPDAGLALSSPDYRVTAGDVYSLVFTVLDQPVEYEIPVDSGYRIRVANMGVLDASGKTYGQLKAQVEAVVTGNYPMGGVRFVLSRPAVFKVYVRGEVKEAAEVSAWAMTRLSALAGGNHLTSFASLRDVTVASAGGQTRAYDLFRARRLGDLSQDPYLRPGDTVTFNRVSRTVSVDGAVERPGIYQLLEGENLRALVGYYGSGFTSVADTTRVELLRRVNSVSVSGNKIFLEEADIAGDYPLENYDAVTVPEITGLQPVMFVEGAVTSAATASAELAVSTRLVVPFNRGETYAALIRRNRTWFAAESDTRSAYIIREDEHIPVNLNPMLYDADYRGEIPILENDTLVIPFRQYFVTVAGAVRAPGRYPYIPDRTWDYYIALAGGFIPERNVRDAIEIIDIRENRLGKSDVITPETVINAKTNAFLYYFNQYAPIIMTTMSMITTFISVQQTLRALNQ